MGPHPPPGTQDGWTDGGGPSTCESGGARPRCHAAPAVSGTAAGVDASGLVRADAGLRGERRRRGGGGVEDI